jgi:Methylamine utilisation protein MauE
MKDVNYCDIALGSGATRSAPATSRTLTRLWYAIVRNGVWLAAACISYLLLASAMAHLRNPYYFLYSVVEYRLVPNQLALLASGVLPFLHVCIATSLLLLPNRGSVFWLATVLFGVYTSAQAFTLFEGRAIPCGCFGNEQMGEHIGWPSLLLSSGGMFCSLLGIFFSSRCARERITVSL